MYKLKLEFELENNIIENTINKLVEVWNENTGA